MNIPFRDLLAVNINRFQIKGKIAGQRVDDVHRHIHHLGTDAVLTAGHNFQLIPLLEVKGIDRSYALEPGRGSRLYCCVR